MLRRQFLAGIGASLLGFGTAEAQDSKPFISLDWGRKKPTRMLKVGNVILGYTPERAPLLAEQYRESVDGADLAIVRHLEEACSDGKERIVLYFPRTGGLEDISVDPRERRVYFNSERMNGILQREKHVVFAHPHFVYLERFCTGTPNQIRALKKHGVNKENRKLFLEPPSHSGQGLPGDIKVMLGIMFGNYPGNPEIYLDSRIVMFERGLPLRVIRYNVSSEIKGRIRVGETRGTYPYEGLQRQLVDNYKRLFNRYMRGKLEVFELGEGREPSFPEFAEMVNKAGEIEIYDHGYIETS
jgi:hypothetical protein